MLNIKTIVDAYVAQVDNVDFNLAADINNLQTALDALAYSALNQAAFANVQTLSGNLTLTDDSAVLQVLDPGGASRDVTLPAAANTNHVFVFVNDDPTYTITVKNSGGSTLIVLSDNLVREVVSDGTDWYGDGTGSLDGKVSLTGDISPAQITTNQNNYNPTGLSTASVLRLNTDASRNITGLAGGADGRVMVIHNVGSNEIVLKDENAASTAANRFALSADVTISADQSIMLWYDSTSSRWRLISPPPSAGASAYILPKTVVDGLALSNNVGDANNDIDIAVGQAVDDGGTENMVLASALTKRLDAAWTVGTNQGGLDTGAEANSTWYHVFLIKRTDTGVVDVLFSTSFSSPTMPTSYTKKRRIGSVYNNSSGNLVSFLQYDDYFLWASPTLDIDTSVGASKTNYTLRVPTGTPILARCNIFFDHTTNQPLYISNPNLTDLAPSDTAAPLTTTWLDTGLNASGFVYEGFTNTSAQISARSGAAGGTFRVATLGWLDPRGKR
jgi:hypothetical protein